MRDVAVIGVGMTHFGKYLNKSIKDLSREAVTETLKDAGLDKSMIEAAYVGNAGAGALTGQHMIRGQVALNPMGINKIPIYNIESACASGSYAFHLAHTAVAAGVHDCVLVLGVEKLFDENKMKPFQFIESGVDTENFMTYFKQVEEHLGNGVKIFPDEQQNRSRMLDFYSFLTKRYMGMYGLTQSHLAKLAVKAHVNASLNPKAQYQNLVSEEEVLASGDVTFPFTRMMCAPIGDGAAAAILCSKSVANQYTTKPVWVNDSVAGSGMVTTDLDDTLTRRMAAKLYETCDVGPDDFDVVEVHDTTSSAEVIDLVELGLCPGDQAAARIDEGYYDLRGKLPCNPSGGLTTKGHPLGATGVAQIYEIVKQLKGECGERQINDPKVGLTHNGGGILGTDVASMTLHVFKK
ncbi:MAG: thiolase family protein [Desulfuromonadales bacterium]|nr:thiolase family protein [Desulfuromonadales bacterium]